MRVIGQSGADPSDHAAGAQLLFVAGAWLCGAALLSLFMPRGMAALVIVAGVFIMALRLYHRQAWYAFDPALMLILGLFFVWAVASVIWSTAPDMTVRRLVRLAPLLGLGLGAVVAMNYLPAQRLPRLLLAFGLVYMAGFVVSSLEVAGGNALYRLIYDLPENSLQTIRNSNRMDLLLVLLWWPTMFAFWTTGHRKLVLALVPLALIVLGWSESQSAALALTLSVLVVIAAAVQPRLCFALSLAALVIGLATAPWVTNWLHDSALNSPAYLPGSARRRLEIWQAVVELIRQRPWTGWGIDVSPAISTGYQSSIIPAGKGFIYPHNGYLQIWMELGAIGYTIAAAAMLYVLMLIRTLEPVPFIFAMGTFTVVVTQMATSYNVWQSWLIATELTVVAAFVMVHRAWKTCGAAARHKCDRTTGDPQP